MVNLKIRILEFLNKHKKQIIFYLFLNILFVFFISLSSYVHIPLSGIKDRFLYFTHVVILQFSIVGYIYVSTLNKWLLRLVFLPCFLVFSLFAYWTYTQDISITNSMIKVIIETKPSIAIDLISIPFILFFVLIILIIFIIDKAYKKTYSIKVNMVFCFITICSIISFFVVENKRGNTLKSRLPYSVFFGLKDYFRATPYYFNKDIKLVKSPVDSLKIVLVLGETVRADHLQLNGYNRETNPLLSRHKNLLSFKNVYTPHTYTGASLPRLITNAKVYDKNIDTITSVFDVFKLSDYKTFWIGNQELESSYGSIVKTNENIVLIDSLRSVLSFRKSLDEEMLEPFDKFFFNVKNKGLFTLHMMGSHWWYENRYSDAYRKFTPVIDSKHIPSLNENEIINSYDNTILYLDFFLDELILKLKKETTPTILIYLSDHGEALGEDGKWLHAQDSESIKNPAMIVWYSERFVKNFPVKIKNLKNNQSKNFTTDVLYHSMLNLIEAKNVDIDFSQSLFSSEFLK